MTSTTKKSGRITGQLFARDYDQDADDDEYYD